jgi:hypothetical protein
VRLFSGSHKKKTSFFPGGKTVTASTLSSTVENGLAFVHTSGMKQRIDLAKIPVFILSGGLGTSRQAVVLRAGQFFGVSGV